MPRFTDRAPFWIYTKPTTSLTSGDLLPGGHGQVVVTSDADRYSGVTGLDLWSWVDSEIDASRERRRRPEPLYIPKGFETQYRGLDDILDELRGYGWVTEVSHSYYHRGQYVTSIYHLVQPTAAAFRPAVGQFSMFMESGVPGTALIPAPEGGAPEVVETCPNCDKELDACVCEVCTDCGARVDELCDNCGKCMENPLGSGSPCCECAVCPYGHRGNGHRVGSGLCDNCGNCQGDDEGAESHCECSYCEQCYSNVDSTCEECNGCDSCCSCSTCDARGSSRVRGHQYRVNTAQNPEDWCSSCDSCIACCENNGNCFVCEDCGERQSYDNRCGLEEHEDSYHCTSCCPGAEEEEEEDEEYEGSGETPSDLPKWGPELAALAEKAVMRSTCDLHDGKRCEGGVPFRSERSHRLRFINATSFKRNPSHRHMGCEIETDHGGRPNGFVQKIIQKWDMAIHNDPSVRGREIITLPTNGDAFVEQIEELCSAFVTDGVVVTKFGDKGTGYHLHVDARDLSWSDLKRMFTLWAHVEEAALNALRPERFQGLQTYGKPRREEAEEGKYLDPRRRTGGEEGSEEHEAEAKKAVVGALARRGSAPTPDLTPEGRLRPLEFEVERRTLASGGSGDWAETHYLSERYFALNGMSLFRYGTIEIRAFEGTSNAEDIVCWGMLWASFTDMTKGMSRKKMLQLIQQNPRSVLLDAAPNARTKLWLKRRWKLYAEGGAEAVKGRKGLRPVKKGKAVAEDVSAPATAMSVALGDSIDEMSVLTSLPAGAVVEDRYHRRSQQYLDDDTGQLLWAGDTGDSLTASDLLYNGGTQTLIALAGDVDFPARPVVGQRMTMRQLTELPIGTVVNDDGEKYVKVIDSSSVEGDIDERLDRVEWRHLHRQEVRISGRMVGRYAALVSLPREAPAPVPAAPVQPSLRGELRRPWRR
jgi:hypothetical protein